MEPEAVKRIIAIVGMAGSGKSTVASYLKGRGVPVIRFGQIIINELESKGLPVTPENERMVREELRREYGMDAVAKLSLPIINENLNGSSIAVIDGLYSLSEYKTLREEFGDRLSLIAVFTPKRERYHRLRTRKERPLTIEDAESRDYLEIVNIEKAGPIALADVMVINEGSEADLGCKVEKALQFLAVP